MAYPLQALPPIQEEEVLADVASQGHMNAMWRRRTRRNPRRQGRTRSKGTRRRRGRNSGENMQRAYRAARAARLEAEHKEALERGRQKIAALEQAEQKRLDGPPHDEGTRAAGGRKSKKRTTRKRKRSTRVKRKHKKRLTRRVKHRRHKRIMQRNKKRR